MLRTLLISRFECIFFFFLCYHRQHHHHHHHHHHYHHHHHHNLPYLLLLLVFLFRNGNNGERHIQPNFASDNRKARERRRVSKSPKTWLPKVHNVHFILRWMAQWQRSLQRRQWRWCRTQKSQFNCLARGGCRLDQPKKTRYQYLWSQLLHSFYEGQSFFYMKNFHAIVLYLHFF